ncbi:hypothetical protein J7E62_02710 [Variovorax paradoxus]|nr:hypothetical protein [Variovorax paradoxus]
MISAPLADLDELVLKCRDEKAKSYVAEAVASYRVGAYRAAIVGTWIAICFDIIDKLRELAISGDHEAEQQITLLEKIRASGEVYKALQFEKTLLLLARDKFELISHLEHIDLERLQADRNRCAHPSLVSEDQAYSPSAELARAHIHAAVTHLLQHPPAQGKYALSRLMKDVDSELFPSDSVKAIEVFASGPLRKPRDSLVRNFALVLTKRILLESTDERRQYRARDALTAVRHLHHVQVEKLFKERLSKMAREMEDSDLDRFIRFLEGFPDSWTHLDEDVKQRLNEFVKKLPVASFIDLDFLLEYQPLSGSANYRVKFATRADLKAGAYFIAPRQVIDRAIELYVKSNSFDNANAGGKHLIDLASDMSSDQIRSIIKGAANNDEVTGSFGLAGLIAKLRNGKIPDAEFDSMLLEHGLDKYVAGASDAEFDLPF